MTIIHETVVDQVPSNTPHRRVLISATALLLVAVVAVGLALVGNNGDSPTDQRPVPTESRDAAVRDLVARGQVPAAQLDDGTQITASRRPTRDDIVRQLVAQRLVPAAALDDGTQIATNTRPRSRDDIVRQLVAQGSFPPPPSTTGRRSAAPPRALDRPPHRDLSGS